jgi:hypothetical protein
MAKQKSKLQIAKEIAIESGTIELFMLNGIHKKFNRDELVSALVFLKQAKNIITKKYFNSNKK